MKDPRIVGGVMLLGGVALGWLVRGEVEPRPSTTPASSSVVAPSPASASASASASVAAPVAAPATASVAAYDAAISKETQNAFEGIYKNASWGENEAGVGNSGSGSMADTTAVYRAFLAQFFKEYDIHSVVDAGCGDWEFSSKIDWRGIDYKGYDITRSVIEHDKKLYEKPNIHFYNADIVETDLPKADLLISKHVLQHLPNASIKKFLDKQLPKYKHVLIMSGVHHITFGGENTDISPGGYRTLDLTAPPFNLVGLKTLTYFDSYHMHSVLHIGKKKNDAAP